MFSHLCACVETTNMMKKQKREKKIKLMTIFSRNKFNIKVTIK